MKISSGKVILLYVVQLPIPRDPEENCDVCTKSIFLLNPSDFCKHFRYLVLKRDLHNLSALKNFFPSDCFLLDEPIAYINWLLTKLINM